MLQERRVVGARPERADARNRADLHIGALGSGSDFTPFLQHLGIASLNLGFGGEDGGGIYHSIYDDFYWYTHFADTNFVYGRALAQTAGTAVMRLADAEVLPYEFKDLAETVKKYTDELKSLLSDEQAKARETAMALDEGVYAATSDPHEPTVAPKRDSIPPYLNFAPLDNAVDALTRAAGHYETALGRAKERGDTVLTAAAMRDVNAELIKVERALTDAKGLPGRPWFTHQLYAPGFYTGYGVKTMPSVREAIEQKQFGAIDESVTRLGAAIGNAAKVIDAAAGMLAGAR